MEDVLKVETDAQKIEIDNSSEHKDFSIVQIKDQENEEGNSLVVMLDTDTDAPMLQINGFNLCGRAFNLFKEFINQME